MSNWKPLPEEVTTIITLPLMACLGGAILAPVLQSFHYCGDGIAVARVLVPYFMRPDKGQPAKAPRPKFVPPQVAA